MKQTVENAIKSRIYGHGRGWVFTPKHFSELGSPEAVRLVLFNLQKQNLIRRILRGVYDYPKQHHLLGTLAPKPDAVVQALAEKNGFRVQPYGAYAANVIGLSDQVQGRAIFLTDGPSKKFKVGNLEIHLKRTSLKNMYAAGSREAFAIQAMKFMQKKNIDEHMLERLKNFLQASPRKHFEKNVQHAPNWIRSLLLKLMENDS
jgi:hypothetical protein